MGLTRVILLSAAWVGAGIALHSGLLLLDVCWNLINWSPSLDGIALGLLVWVVMTLSGVWFLARSTRDRLSTVVSLIICLGLAAVGVYAAPIEPLTDGLLGRSLASPLWYRAGRVVLMALPLVFWRWGRADMSLLLRRAELQ